MEKNSAEMANDLISRVKSGKLEQFIVTKTLPEEFVLNGRVPFDLFIFSREGYQIAEIKVWAVSATDADKTADEWIKGLLV